MNLLIGLANKLLLIYSINLSIQTLDPNIDFMWHEAARLCNMQMAMDTVHVSTQWIWLLDPPKLPLKAENTSKLSDLIYTRPGRQLVAVKMYECSGIGKGYLCTLSAWTVNSQHDQQSLFPFLCVWYEASACQSSPQWLGWTWTFKVMYSRAGHSSITTSCPGLTLIFQGCGL